MSIIVSNECNERRRSVSVYGPGGACKDITVVESVYIREEMPVDDDTIAMRVK